MDKLEVSRNLTITCHDVYGQPHEVNISELAFRPAVYGIVVRDGHVLAHRMGEDYDLPGGGMEAHESLHDALLREIEEETGLRVKPVDLIHADSNLFYLSDVERAVNSIGHFFHCEIIGGELSDTGQDDWERGVYDGTVWIPLSEAVTLTFRHPMAVIALRKLLDRMA